MTIYGLALHVLMLLMETKQSLKRRRDSYKKTKELTDKFTKESRKTDKAYKDRFFLVLMFYYLIVALFLGRGKLGLEKATSCFHRVPNAP